MHCLSLAAIKYYFSLHFQKFNEDACCMKFLPVHLMKSAPIPKSTEAYVLPDLDRVQSFSLLMIFFLLFLIPSVFCQPLWWLSHRLLRLSGPVLHITVIAHNVWVLLMYNHIQIPLTIISTPVQSSSSKF